jgi:hypothetical protein
MPLAELFQSQRFFEGRAGAELGLRSKAERGFQLANGKRKLPLQTLSSWQRN